jgi:tetratricopeptide (TPR) repeat protein
MIRPLVPCAILAILGAVPALPQAPAGGSRADSHLQQANEFLKSGKPDLAFSEFKEILKLDPHNVGAHNGLGTLLYFRGDYEKSAAELRATLKIDPTLVKTQTLLGMCEKRIGQTAQARADLEKAFPKLREEKLRVQSGMELIEIYYGAGDLDKAASVAVVLNQLRPADPDILYTLHQIHSRQADEDLLGIAMAAPGSARMHQVMAGEMVRQGDIEGAIRHYREALRIDPKIPGLHFELAEALTESSSPSDQEQAEPEYRASLALNPFDEKSQCRLGKIASGKGDLSGAYAHYSQALELQPDDPEANLNLGKILVSMDQPAKARPLLERAVRLEPFDAVARFRLGTVYRQLGRSEDSRRELAEFQRLKQMKDRLREIYKEMRLQTKPDPVDADVPQ